MAKSKFILLIPLTFNDGSEVPRSLLNTIEERLFALAGGYTIAGVVKGAYRMRDGAKQVDESLQFWVVINDQDESALRALVVQFGEMLGQESKYLERTASVVEFVDSPSNGDNHT